MTIELLFLALAVICIAIILVMHADMRRRYTALELRQVASERRDAFVAAILKAWAEHWGEPPEEVKPILVAIVEHHQFMKAMPAPVQQDQQMGADMGLGLVVTGVWNAMRGRRA